MTPSHFIDELRSSHQQGRPLPGAAYRDPEIFALESESLLGDSWISVACGQNVAEPGDLFPARIAGRSLLVVRGSPGSSPREGPSVSGDDGSVQVFYNLCRHRGSPLVDAQCHARGGRILCPYHAWSYGLDGALLAAPHFHRSGATEQPSDEERRGLSLLRVRTAVWRDIVFVNLSGDARPFAEFIRPLNERLAPWTASELRPLSSDEYEIQANWKLAAENFIDTYHLPVVHPEVGPGFDWILNSEDVELSDDIVGVVLPKGYGQGSEMADTELPRFSGLRDGEELRIEVFSIFPNTLILVEPEFQQVIVLRPQSPEITHETFANYLATDASQTDALAEIRAESIRDSILVNDQDSALLARLQLTRSMDVASNTVLTPSWDLANQRFQRTWAKRLLTSGRPSAAIVPDVNRQ